MEHESPAPPTEEPSPVGPARAFVVRRPRRTWAVPLLLVLNSCVFAAMLALQDDADWFAYVWHDFQPRTSELMRFGANHGPTVAQGEWWRLLSCAFVHIGSVHFMLNMLSLFALRIVESFYGSGAFLLVYLLSAAGASAASALWHPGTISAGASGAIFGVAGALLSFFVGHRHSIPDLFLRPVLRNLVVLLALNLLLGALVANIDNMAHIGGLVTGMLAGRALDRDPQASARLTARRLARATIPALLVGLLCALIPWRSASAADIRLEIAADDATHELRLGHLEQARALTEEALARDAANPELLELHARSLVVSDPRAALADLDAVLYQHPAQAPARYLRAQLLRILDRPDDAVQDAARLVEDAPEDPRYRRLAGELAWSSGRWNDAAVHFGVLARSRSGSAIEAQLLLWLARVRMGEEEQATRELRHYLSVPRVSEDEAFELGLGALFAGQSQLDEVLRAFDRRELPLDARARLCFFAGVWCLQRGEARRGTELLQRCADAAPFGNSFDQLARSELERLGKR